VEHLEMFKSVVEKFFNSADSCLRCSVLLCFGRESQTTARLYPRFHRRTGA
jgi:hypothetical protein